MSEAEDIKAIEKMFDEKIKENACAVNDVVRELKKRLELIEKVSLVDLNAYMNRLDRSIEALEKFKQDCENYSVVKDALTFKRLESENAELNAELDNYKKLVTETDKYYVQIHIADGRTVMHVDIWQQIKKECGL